MVMADSLFKIVEIEINQKCNLKCSYCPNSIVDQIPDSEMDPKVFSEIINQLQEIKYDGYISLEFYNEPLLCKNLDRFILEVIAKLPNAKITLYTNGTLLTEKRFNELFELGVHIFFVTKQENITNYSFEDVYSRMSADKKKRVYFQDHSEMTKTNRGGLLSNTEEELPLVYPCHIPMFLTLITNNGDVLFCFEDFHRSGVMGNICTDNIVSIWYSEKYKELRSDLRKFKRFKHYPCKNCNRINVFYKHFQLLEKDDK